MNPGVQTGRYLPPHDEAQELNRTAMVVAYFIVQTYIFSVGHSEHRANFALNGCANMEQDLVDYVQQHTSDIRNELTSREIIN